MNGFVVQPYRSSPSVFVPIALLVVGIHLAILSINFAFEMPKQKDQPQQTLDIVIVHHRDREKPEKAELLAQANQDGGGEQVEEVVPKSPVSSPKILPDDRQTTPQQAAQIPKPTPPQRPKLVRPPKPKDPPKPKVAELPKPPEPEPAEPTAAELIRATLESARLSSLIDESVENLARAPRSKTITARTQEFAYASYMKAWELKVERIGNLNYPQDANRHRLTGTLRMDVTLDPEGEVQAIHIVRSSGNKQLDTAAQEIVRLASPYAPFTALMREELDELHIMRTWVFDTRNQLFKD
ncbi:MAG: TonB family protein [Chromatiales bacterium]|nr:TonB family protein [Chromatiales bacterium]